MDETPPQPEAADTKDSQNAIDKVKNFFTMGGDKDKWTKAIIISIVVILIMGLATFGVWGVALAFWYRSIAEPNGNSAALNGSGTLFYISGLDPESVAPCLNKWIGSQISGSPLKTEGSTFANAGKTSNVNPALMVAIAMQESSLGTKGSGPPHNNPFGWDCPPCQKFSSWAESINHVTSRISATYLTQGYSTIAEIQMKWAPVGVANDPRNLNSDWRGGVTKAFNSVIKSCPALTPPDSVAGSGSAASGEGYNKVPVFKQTDSRWASHPYNPAGVSNRTIKSSGCGPTSAAMVLKFYGKDVDPVITADFCKASGNRPDGGTDPGCFTALAKKYGLNSKVIPKSDWNQAKSILASGKPLIVDVGPGAFSSGDGHFIVLTGISGNTVYINNPYRNTPSASANTVLGLMKEYVGFVYIYP